MNKQLLTGLASVMVPLGLYSAPVAPSGGYQRSYLASSKQSLGLFPSSNNGAAKRCAIPPALSSDLSDELTLLAGNPVAELVILDAAVPDKHLFYQTVQPGIEVRELNGDADGLQQLSEILQQYHQLQSLHIVSHGEDGALLLGNSRVTESRLKQSVDVVSNLHHALVDGADVMLYGCEVAKTQKGEQLLDILVGDGNIDIAASNDLTGDKALGGDWELEVRRGEIDSDMPFSELALNDFSHVLAFTTTHPGHKFCDTGDCASGQTYGDITVTSTSTLNDYSTTGLYIKGNSAEATFTFSIADTNALYSFQLTALSMQTYTGSDTCEVTIEGFYASNNASAGTNVVSKTAANNGAVSITNITGKALNKFTVKVCSGVSDTGSNNHGVSSFTLGSHAAPAANPTITNVTYDSSTGNLVVTGTNFEAKSGGANDITVNKLTITGEGGGGSAYTLTSGTNVERDSVTQFTVPISGTDKLRVDALLNKNTTSADDGTTYNLAAADDFVANITAGNTAIATNAVTVSNYANPAITSSTYDASIGALVVTGTGFSAINGANNDVVANTFTFTGDGNSFYQLTDTANVDVTNATTFTLTLSATDKYHINGLLNKNGANAASGTTYNLAAADNWMAGGAGNQDIADGLATINVSNVTAPAVTSAAYNHGTGVLTVTGTNFVADVGSNNDVDVTKLTLTGEGGNTHTLTSSNVEITSATSFSVTLNAADKLVVNGLLNKDGTQADDGATNYNLNAADRYLPTTDSATNIADATNTVTVSNTQVPTIASATYNASTAALVVTGTAYARKFGGTNDIDVTKLSLTGEGGNSYTLTTGSVEVTSETAFTVNLNSTDKINVNGLLNKDGLTSGDNTTYNLAGAEDWQAGAATNATIADTTSNGVTTSSVQVPAISSATYDFVTGVLAVTGTNMMKKPGVTNDVDLTKLTLTGLGSGTRTLTTTNVELTSETAFSVTLNSADKTAVNALLDNNGTQASDAVNYNINAAEDWMAGAAAAANVVDATGNGITVSNVPVPTITSATYDFGTGVLTVTGTDFEAKSGAANDVTVNKLTLTGEGGSSYTLTSGTNVEITNATTFSVTLSGADLLAVNALLNKNGTQADNGTAYNLATADDFIANVTAGNTADTTGNPVTVSSVTAPTVTSATYDFSTGALVVTGANFSAVNGASNDVDPTKFTLTGDSGGTYTLTTTGVEVTNSTTFTVNLNAADKLIVHGLLNKDGATADSGTTYNLAAADNWMAGGAPNTDIADLTLNGITVSNVSAPVVTSAAYNAGTGVLTVTGTNFTAKSGGTNDVDSTKLTLTGEGGSTYTLTSANVDVTNDTTFAITLDAVDKININGLLNKNGTQADDGATNYNLAAADNFMLGAANTTDIADATNTVTVSNVQVPLIASATYNAGTASLVVTGTGFAKKTGVTNDIDVTKLSLAGEGGNSYTLTSNSVELTSETAFTVNLNATDKINVNGLLNKDGTTSGDNTTYNLSGAEDWQGGAATNAVIADLTLNGVTVSNTQIPTISSATYDFSTGVLAVTGTNMVKKSGATNDVDLTKLTITGLASGTRTLTTTNVELTSETAFSVTLNSADKTQVNALLDANGTQATDSVVYNLNAAEDWMPGAAASATVVDATGNGITVSNVPVPTVTSATYDFGTGVLTVTGTDFEAKSGAANDVTVNKITLTGQGGSTYTLTSGTNVEITNATSFSVTLSGIDKTSVNALLNKNGTQADDNQVYNIAVADDFIANVTAGNTADTTGNPVTVSSVAAPTVTAATYDFSTGDLVVSGTNFTSTSGATNDVDPTKLTLTGDSGGTYTLTSSALEITNETTFTVTLNATDKLNAGGLLNKNGTASDSGTTYNLAAADNWMAGGAPNTNIADLTLNGVTVSNVANPTVVSATYNASSGALVVTGTNFVREVGATNDIDTTKLTLTGESAGTYTLTSAAVEITNDTTFTVNLNATDKTSVNGLLNKNGSQSDGGTTYNLAAADNWLPGAAATQNIADLSGNGITVSGVTAPSITSATYVHSTAILTVTGANFVNTSGSNNDVDVTKFTVTGEGGNTYVLTSSSVDITSDTSFSVTLNATDKINVNGLLHKVGTTSDSGTTYNLAAADNWMAGAAGTTDITDATNAITVSNIAVPTITSATYNATTSDLVVTGTGFVKKAVGADVDATKFTFTGQGGNTYNLSIMTAEITSDTSFTVNIHLADRSQIYALLNKDGTNAEDNTLYNLSVATGWLSGLPSATNTADTTNGVTVSNVIVPNIIACSYTANTGKFIFSGLGFSNSPGSNNDVDFTKFTLTGEGGATYVLTSPGVDVPESKSIFLTLNSADALAVNGIFNKSGGTSDDGTTYNVATADNWMVAAAASADIADATTSCSVSSYSAPTVTSATYDASTGVMVVTGANFSSKIGAANDVDISLMTITGDNGATHAITSATDVEVTSTTQFSVTLADGDRTAVDGLLNKDGTISDSGTTYNLALADNWLRGGAPTTDIADATNAITVSNVTAPAITSATYNFTSGVLSVTGTNLRNLPGATNDVDLTKLSLKGEAGNSYTLTTTNVEITSATAFSVTLSETDKLNINGLLNKDGTLSDDNTTYNLAASDNWMPATLAATDIADATNAITVSNVVAPTITSITYDYNTGVITVTGANFVKKFGNANDIDISLFTFTGENGQTYTVTSAVDVEITSSTTFTITLTGADLAGVNALVSANGATAASGATYNIAVADNWMTGAAPSSNIADTTTGVTVSNAPVPTITSATYDATTATMVVTGTNFLAKSGALNDVSVSKLTVTGEGGATYTLTSSDVEITNSTTFSVTLNAADKRNINGLFNKDGTISDDNTTYNLAAADDFIAQTTAGDSADTTASVTVSNVVAPAITSATYDWSTGVLTVTGTNFIHKSGAANDIDLTKLVFTGEGGTTYTLTTATQIEATSDTAFSATLSGTDLLAINGLLNKNGTSSDDTTTYNLAASDNWAAGAATSTDIADATNAVTVSNVAAPTITSATYDATTGVLTVTGTNFSSFSDAANDVDISLLTITGESGVTYTIASATDIEVTSTTTFSVTLSGSDKLNIDGLLNKNGAQSDTSTTAYNVAAADNWLRGAAASTDISDASSAITVSNVTVPTITSATFNATSGLLTVTGQNFRHFNGATNDVKISALTLTGQRGGTHTLTTADVEITSASGFNVTLSAADISALENLLNNAGNSSIDSTVYNIAAADNWMPGAAASTDIADLTSNAIIVSNLAPAKVTLTTSDNVYPENTGNFALTATLSRELGSNVSVNVSLSYSGTATNVADYTQASNITILQGLTVGHSVVTVVEDSEVEPTETIIVDLASISLSSNLDSVIEDGVQQPTISIIDNDTAAVTLSVNNTTMAETSGSSTVTATLDKATYENVVVSLGYSGTAVSGTDYATPAGSITIAAGQTTGTTTLTATADTGVEADETIIVDITGVSGGKASESGTQQKTVTITDDDTATVSLTVNNATMSETGGTSTVTATLTQATYENVVVSLGYSGTAVSGTDYATPAGSITITAGQTTGSTTLTATADAGVEADETIIVDITGVSGGKVTELNTQQQTVTITDDDTAGVTLTVNNSSISETGGSSTVTATLDKATYENVVVSLGYSGTAVSGTDYATPAGSITITAGQTTGTTTLTATADTGVEADETIIVDITGVTGGKASETNTQQQTVTITDDDTAGVTLTVNNSSIPETGGTSTVTATLDKATYENVVVSLGYSGTAVSGTDYATPAGSITIAAGQTTGTTTLTATADAGVEADETIIVDITGVSGGKASETNTQQQTVTITDDDTAGVTLTVNNSSISETGGTSTVTATLDKATYENVVVSLGYSGTAVSGTDYATPAGSITIAAGQTTGTTTLTATADAGVEADETIIVDITGVTGGKASETNTQQQTVTITDDDTAGVTLTVNNSTMSETGGTSTITATLDKATYENVVVSLGYSGTAVSGTDYATPAGSITIAAGQTTGTTTLTAAADTGVEADETIIVDITGVTGGKASETNTQQQTVTITDDDTALVTLAVNNTAISETGGTSTVTATLDKATYENVVVNLGYSGTAVSGTDYATPAGSITIAAGQTTGTTTLTATADTGVEAEETIIVDITGVTGGKTTESGSQQQTITITDDDTAGVTLTVSNSSISETGGNSTITATLDKATFENVVVSLGYSGTAVGGSDYATPASSITIAAGQTTGTTTLTATADTAVEADETVIVDITGVSGGKASETNTQQQTVTITDDDTTSVTLTASSNAFAEANGSSVLTATLSSATFETVTVALSYSGTATVGQDYNSPATTISIAAGQTTGSTTITIIDDGTEEADETIIVDVTSVAGGSAVESGTQQQTLTITNDDDETAPVNYTVSIDELNINVATQNAMSFSFSNAEVGATYSYSVTDEQPAIAARTTDLPPPQSLTLNGSGTVTSSSQTISNIDVSALNDGVITLSVVLTDLAGNVGASATASVNKDTTAPTVTLSSTASDPLNGPFELSIAFSESVNGLEISDFTVLNATLSNISGSATSFTATVTPVDDGDVTVTLPANTVIDTASNGNTISNTFTTQHDKSLPVVQQLSPANNAVDVSAQPQLILTFNENVSAGSSNNLIEVKDVASDTVAHSVAVTDSSVAISNNVVTVTLPNRLSGSTAYYVNVGTGAFIDAAGNAFEGITGNANWQFTVLSTTPVTLADSATVDEDNSVDIDVLANDSGVDVNLNPASVTVKTAPENGSTSINTANGVITYTPNAHFNGTDTFVYTVSDLNGTLSGDTTVTVTVGAVNDAPVAVNDTVVTAEDEALTIDVLANDTDIDGAGQFDVTTLKVTTEPGNGQAVVTDGKVVYTPTANFAGNDSFGYIVADNSGLVSNEGIVTVNVSSTNDMPIAVADSVTTEEEKAVTINVLANDSDIDGQLLVDSVDITTAPANGSAEPQADGSVIYTPNLNFVGDDTFSYTVKDDVNAVSEAALVTVTVTNINDAPTAQDDTVVVLEDVPHTINVTGNDSDIDGTLTLVTIVTQPQNGQAVVESNNLQVSYTPGNNFTGSDSFTYQVADETGALSNIATVTLTIEAVNDGPVVNDDFVQVNEEGSVDIDVLANDSDIDGQLDAQTLTVVSQGSGGTAEVVGSLIRYTASLNFIGQDTFTYQVSDDQGLSASASVIVQVINSNDAPTAGDMSLTASEDTTISFTLAGSDPDGDTLSYTILTQPQNGTLGGNAPDLSYTPNAHFNGNDSFSYSVNDGVIESNVATVNIAVGAVNDAPVADDQTVEVAEDGSVNIVLTASDVEGDVLSFTVQAQPSNGELTGTAPNLVYTPRANFNGSDSFTFVANDGAVNSAAATVSVNVVAGNDIPIANGLSLTMREDRTVSFTLTGSDLDGDGLTFNVLTNPANGQLSGQAPNLVYRPNQNFNGTDSFTFEAHDGLVGSLPETVNFSVLAVNDAPVAADDTVNRDNWLPVEIDVLANDVDVDGDSLSIIGATVNTGSLSFNQNSLTYTPVNGFIGAAVINYQISDNRGGKDTARAFVDINVSDADLPVITAPADVEVNANALSTKVELGVATAVDRLGNPLAVSLDGVSTFFKPGVTNVFWRTEDNEGRTSVASQLVKVHPLVSIDKDQTILEGFSVTVGIRLNGRAPSYPLTIGYIVGGTAQAGVDHDLVDGSITIASGTTGTITFNVFADNIFEGEETVIIELDSNLNRGAKFTHTVTINEENVRPKVDLLVEQAAEERFVINLEDGIVVVKALIEHPDSNNQYIYDWTNRQGVLVDTDSVEDTFTFDPTGLDLGVYHVTLEVTDSDDTAFSGRKQVTMRLEQNTVVLTDNDTDRDGVPDNVEGLGDGDNDGIPDYLDAIPECNVIPETIESDENYLVEGDPGVCMRLGDVALGGETGGTRVLSGDLPSDGDAANIGGLFDFIAYGLPVVGQSYRVVLPQAQPIPANAVYRKTDGFGSWRDFVETEVEQLWSSPGEAGYCPPPGDQRWEPGLVEGYWCVQLIIADGGPNDADGVANATIVDPGGVAVVANNNAQPIAQHDTAETRLNTPVTVDVLANDNDSDGDMLSISSANAVFGSVEIQNEKIYYQPALDYFGMDTIVYGITDGQGGSGSATLTVTVIANTNPVTTADSATTISGQAVNINVLANDTDAEGDAIRVIAASSANGVVVIEADDSLTYTSNTDFVGVDTINYRIEDALGGEAIGTVTVTVEKASTTVNVRTSGGGTFTWMLLVLLCMAGFCRYINYPMTIRAHKR